MYSICSCYSFSQKIHEFYTCHVMLKPFTCQLHYFPLKTTWHFKPSKYEIFKTCAHTPTSFIPDLEIIAPGSMTPCHHHLKVDKTCLSENPYVSIFEVVIRHLNYTVKITQN